MKIGDCFKKIVNGIVCKKKLEVTESLAGTVSLNLAVNFVAGVTIADVVVRSPIAAVLVAVIRRVFFCEKEA